VINACLAHLFGLQSFTTSLRSRISSIGWRLRSGLLSSVQSSYTSVSMGLHFHTSPTRFVRWQMSRLVSDYVLARLYHWSSAGLDCLPSATELSSRCCSCLEQSASTRHLRTLRGCLPVPSENSSVPHLVSRPFVTVHWQCPRSDAHVTMETSIVFVSCLLTYLLTYLHFVWSASWWCCNNAKELNCLVPSIVVKQTIYKSACHYILTSEVDIRPTNRHTANSGLIYDGRAPAKTFTSYGVGRFALTFAISRASRRSVLSTGRNEKVINWRRLSVSEVLCDSGIWGHCARD